jgi:hypothetical protein
MAMLTELFTRAATLRETVQRIHLTIPPETRVSSVEDAILALRTLVDVSNAAEMLSFRDVYRLRHTITAIGVSVDALVFHMFQAGADTAVFDSHDMPWLFFLQDASPCAKGVLERELTSIDIDALESCHDILRSNNLLRTVEHAHLLQWIAFLASKEIEPCAVQWVPVGNANTGSPGTSAAPSPEETGFLLRTPCFLFDVFGDIFTDEQIAKFNALLPEVRAQLDGFRRIPSRAHAIIAGGFMDYMCCSALLTGGAYPRAPGADMDIFVSEITRDTINAFASSVAFMTAPGLVTLFPFDVTTTPARSLTFTPVQLVCFSMRSPQCVIGSFDTTHCRAFMGQDLRPMACASAITAWVTRVTQVCPGRSVSQKREQKLLHVLRYTIVDDTRDDPTAIRRPEDLAALSATSTAKAGAGSSSGVEPEMDADSVASKLPLLVREILRNPKASPETIATIILRRDAQLKEHPQLRDVPRCIWICTNPGRLRDVPGAWPPMMPHPFGTPWEDTFTASLMTASSESRIWDLRSHAFNEFPGIYCKQFSGSLADRWGECYGRVGGASEKYKKWGEACFGYYGVPPMVYTGRNWRPDGPGDAYLPFVTVSDLVARLWGTIHRAPCALTQSCVFPWWSCVDRTATVWVPRVDPAGMAPNSFKEARALMFAADGSVPAQPLLEKNQLFVYDNPQGVRMARFVFPSGEFAHMVSRPDVIRGGSASICTTPDAPGLRITWRGYVQQQSHGGVAGIIVAVEEAGYGDYGDEDDEEDPHALI